VELRIIAGAGPCKNGDCPTVYATDENSDLIVQGYDLSGDTITQLDMPNGESAIRIPEELILEAAERIKARS
jgi:hypothetical protein